MAAQFLHDLGFPGEWKLELAQIIIARLATVRVSLQKARDAGGHDHNLEGPAGGV